MTVKLAGASAHVHQNPSFRELVLPYLSTPTLWTAVAQISPHSSAVLACVCVCVCVCVFLSVYFFSKGPCLLFVFNGLMSLFLVISVVPAYSRPH